VEKFQKQELKYRKDFDYPPFTDLCILLYKHEIEKSLFTKVNKLYQELLFLQEKYKKNIEIYSTPPLIYKMYGKYRYNIILK
jgi:primosomal protein N'